MSYVIDTLTIFNKALDGHHRKALDHFMKKNDRYGKDIAKDFHKTQLNEMLDNTGLTEIVIEILLNLGIPPYQWGRYIGASMSVYQFLLELNELTCKKNDHIQNLINYIDTKMGVFWYSLLMALIFSLLLFTLGLPFFIQSEVITIISEIVSAVLFIPAMRIIYNAGCALYSFYTGIIDTHIPLSHRLRDHIFEVVGAAIQIAAASLVFVAVATSPIVSILIITATALSVLKEAVSFIQLLLERKKKYLEESEDPLTRQQHQARLDNTFKKTCNDLIMNIVAAILITAIVAVWTFIPGGLPLIIGAITAIALIHITKLLFRIYNEKNKKKELLETFEKLETAEKNKDKSYDEGYEEGYDDTAEPEKRMTYANLHSRLGEPREPLTVTAPNHHAPLFRMYAGNEKEEKKITKNDSTSTVSSYS